VKSGKNKPVLTSKGKVERFIGYLTSDFLSQARLEGLKSAAQLNARIGSWLAEITEKKLRDFSESRQQRFAVERHYLQPLPVPTTLTAEIVMTCLSAVKALLPSRPTAIVFLRSMSVAGW
jgi:hypothetical protein